jgi:protein-disulfide isomerase
MNRKYLLIGLVALAAVALGVIAYLYVFSGSSETTIPADANKGGITLTERDRDQGSMSAPILMVEYAAPTCPICAAFDTEIFPKLKQKYIDTGKLHYVFRVYPLSSVDVAAEGMARCLPKQNYFSFIDMLYRNQDKWDPDGHQIADVHGALVQMGARAGMSAQQVDACIGDAAVQAQTTKIGQEAETKYGITGTPSFIVNGQMRVGVGSWEDWQTFLDGMLAKK